VTDPAESPVHPPPEDGGPGWLTRNVKVLCGVSFLQDAASELLYPILPIFLTTVLGAPPAVVGAVEGLAEGVASVTKVLAGRLADRMRRRPLIGVGYGLAAFGKLLIALAVVWPMVLVARVVDRTGKGLRSAPRDALLIEGVATGQRGRVFGLHRAADTAGAVVGPLIGLALYEALNHQLRPLFWVAVIPACASVALVAAVRDPRPAPDRVREACRARGLSRVRGLGRARGQSGARGPARRAARSHMRELPERFWRVLALLTVFNLVNFPDALLLLRAHDLGLGTAGVVLAYAIYNVAYAGLSYPAGALSDRFPRPLVFACGLLFFAVGYLGLGLIRRSGLVFLVLPLYGGFAACTDGVGRAWISTLAPGPAQGTAQGVYQGVTGGAVLIAGVWAGLAWGSDGRLPLLVSGAVGLLIAVAMVADRRSWSRSA
jgi:MFS family permease